MNRVSPIFQNEHESSAHSIHRRIDIRVTHLANNQEISGPKTCRICLEEQGTLEGETLQVNEGSANSMIIPCDCRGSVGFVHQKCIKMWIEKQFEGGKVKRTYCEICKSEIFFKKIKARYCDCNPNNICEISPCNVVCIIAQIILVVVVALVQLYVDRVMNFPLLRNTLLTLLAILSATLFLTIFLILKQTFLKSYKEIERIYSSGESQQLGLKEPRCRQQPYALTSISKRPKIVSNRKGRQSKLPTRLPNPNPFESISPQMVNPNN